MLFSLFTVRKPVLNSIMNFARLLELHQIGATITDPVFYGLFLVALWTFGQDCHEGPSLPPERVPGQPARVARRSVISLARGRRLEFVFLFPRYGGAIGR